ncbi:hypothetical protein B566_EDAN011534 [Ephemera danica]|nr:hypothetical protein B566_EDAN011534 [Ephemera danica]
MDHPFLQHSAHITYAAYRIEQLYSFNIRCLLCKMSLAANSFCEPSTHNCSNETSDSYFFQLLIEDGYRIFVEETFLWSVCSWLVAHQAWILSILASLVVGLSGIFPLLVIPIEEGANLKTGAAARTLRVLLSFAVGGLLGDVFLHLLPEAWAAADTPAPSTLDGRRARPSMAPGLWVLAGILLFTVLEMMCSELNADRDDEDVISQHTQGHDKLAAPGTATGVGNGCLASNGHFSETNGDHLTSNGGSHLSTNGHVTSNGGSHVSTNGHVASNGGSHLSTNGHVVSNGGSHLSTNGHVVSNGGSHLSTNGHVASNGGSHVSTNGFVASNEHLPETNEGAHTPQPTSLIDETIFDHVARTPPVNLLGHAASSSEYAVYNGCSAQLINGAVTQAAERRPSKFGLPPVKQMGTLTTLAILIHEVPHEIGDFAILLRAGFTRWEAARAQLYTAGSGLLGALTAVACSTSSVESRTSWVVPFTAGGFLHIALVTVLPELLAERDRWESAKQVIGLLTGMLVMMVLTACFD